MKSGALFGKKNPQKQKLKKKSDQKNPTRTLHLKYVLGDMELIAQRNQDTYICIIVHVSSLNHVLLALFVWIMQLGWAAIQKIHIKF